MPENTRPPADPLNYVVGDGDAPSGDWLAVVDSPEAVTIRAVEPHTLGKHIAAMCLLLAVVTGGLALSAHSFVPQRHPATDKWLPAAMLGIGFVATIGVAAWFTVSWRQQEQLGPLLVYRKADESIELPRQGRVFMKGEVSHVQYVTSRRLRDGRHEAGDLISELNLVTVVHDKTERWVLMREHDAAWAFRSQINQLLAWTELDIRRVDQTYCRSEVSGKSMRNTKTYQRTSPATR